MEALRDALAKQSAETRIRSFSNTGLQQQLDHANSQQGQLSNMQQYQLTGLATNSTTFSANTLSTTIGNFQSG